jgi:hypothetical protein
VTTVVVAAAVEAAAAAAVAAAVPEPARSRRAPPPHPRQAAAENITGPTRKIFIEFLERSCTAEFSGFLLYKELGRRLKDCNPCVAEIFMLLSRDEARHAGFLNKALSDFNLALDLGFLTKNRCVCVCVCVCVCLCVCVCWRVSVYASKSGGLWLCVGCGWCVGSGVVRCKSLDTGTQDDGRRRQTKG